MLRTSGARVLAIVVIFAGTLAATTPVAAGTTPNSQYISANDILTGRTVQSTAVATKPTIAKKPTTAHPLPAPALSARDQKIAKVIAYAKRQIGKWYVFGSAGPNTFDCSGLIVAAYRQVGIALPHQTGALHYRGTSVSRSQLRPGDYVFLRRQVGTSGHVALYIGNGQIIEAPRSGLKVRYNKLYAFYGARRIL